MKFYLTLLAAVVLISQTGAWGSYKLVCFYDTFSIQRGGFANFTETDLKSSLEYCTHIVYGYAGLTPGTFDMTTLHSRQHQQFSQIKLLKNRYGHIKFLLSLGGYKDLKSSEKYLQLLESNAHNQQNFINSAKRFLQKYKFDGLDLAYQFPRDKVKSQSILAQVSRKVKNTFKNSSVGKKLTATKYAKMFGGKSNQTFAHKQHFTALINKLKNAFKYDHLMLTLTVLPHVNVSKYVNVPAVIGNIDFVNLGTFDYFTPERTPEHADYLAPLQPRKSYHGHWSHSNIADDVKLWLSQHIPAHKLNIGIATYARSWKVRQPLKSPVRMPITASLAGPAQGGLLTHTPGLLSLPEYCLELRGMAVSKNITYGNFAYRSGYDGLLITYDDSKSIFQKIDFIRRYSLGGVALFDLTLDDFRGKCTGVKFPTLSEIKYIL